MWIKQNVAKTVYVGPVLDASGAAVTTAVQADFRLVKNGVPAVMSGATVSHDVNGFYTIALSGTNTNTIGTLDIGIGNSAMSMSNHRFLVLNPTTYDVLIELTADDPGGLLDTALLGGQVVTAPGAVTLPASVASETTVSSRASQTSVDGKPTLVQIEGSSILAKEATSASILTAIQSLNNLSAKVNIFGSPLLEIPDAGSTVYAFTVIVKDDEDKLVNLDASPTVSAANAAGTSRSANLSAVSNPSTGRYTFTYTVASNHPAESLRIAVSGTVSGEARYIEWIGAVVNYDTLTTLMAIKAKTDNLPVNPAATSDIPTASQNAIAVFNSDPNYAWVDGSFGDRFLVSDTNQRLVKITGSNHVAADIHDLQPGVIQASHFSAGAIDANALATSGVNEIANAVGALQTIVDIGVMITGTGTANAKWTANALSLAPTGGGGGGTGTGARTVTITVTLSGAPVEGARVRLTKAAESYISTTNASGQITFNLDDGSWIVGITSPNTTFAGAVLAVSGTVSQSYALTAMAITPSAPGGVTGYWTCLSQLGLPESGVTMSMQAVSFAEHASTGLALDTTVRTTTSDANGLAQFPDLVPGVRYQAWRGSGTKIYVTIPADAESSLELNSLLGNP